MSEPRPDPNAETRRGLREKYQSALELVWKKPDKCPVCDATFWNMGDLIDAPVRRVNAAGWALLHRNLQAKFRRSSQSQTRARTSRPTSCSASRPPVLG